MPQGLHPDAVLYAGGKRFPELAACEHFAGSEKLIRKALALQADLARNGVSVFDVTADCEDGAAAGTEAEHAAMVGDLIASTENRYARVGARIHDVRHPHWQDDLTAILSRCAAHVAYIVLPKAESAADVAVQLDALHQATKRYAPGRTIPAHVLIETPGALREVFAIAQLPGIESLDFGLMDFVSAHHGAIPASAMKSPGQFTHPLIVRAKCDIALAALGSGVVPSHNVCTELRDTRAIYADARRARDEFGYLRMWSIHPAQIEPIVEAMQPEGDEIQEACDILTAAQQADWGPTRQRDTLHDRASYRYYWQLVCRARATGIELPHDTQQRFFPDPKHSTAKGNQHA